LDAIGNGLQALKLSALANPPKPPMPASMTEEGGEGAAPAPEADAQADKTPDPYAKYPLPYVIGTVEFHEDDFCGLFLSSEGAHTPHHHHPARRIVGILRLSSCRQQMLTLPRHALVGQW
jgi:hypothetical protein